MATIRKRGNRYQCQVRKGGHSVTKTFTLRSDAKKWGRQTEVEIETGSFSPNAPDYSTIGDVLRAYLAQVIPTHRGRDRESLIAEFLLRQLGHLPLTSATAQTLATYRDARLRNIQAATIHREMSVLRAALRWAHQERGVVYPNGVPKVRLPTLPPGRDRVLSDDELNSIVAALAQSEVREIVPLAVETAMRRGELAVMRWEHVDFQERFLEITQTKNGTPRTIPLTVTATRILLERNRILGRPSHGSIWNIRPQTISVMFRRAARETGLTDVHFHDLRHTATTRFFQWGLSLMEVATITGHKDLRMLRRYTHLSAHHLLRRLDSGCGCLYRL